MTSSTPQGTRAASMAPPPPRPARRTTVLEEDEWTLYLEDIIERDFFPDLHKQRNRLDWLQASRSGDPEAIREAQLRIQERQVGRTPAGHSVGTPSFGTPSATSGRSTPSRALPDEGYRAQLSAALAAAAAEHGEAAPEDLRLDEFLARFTSEDNASFAAIMERVNAKRRQRPLSAWSARRQEAAVSHQLLLRAVDDAAPEERRLVVVPAHEEAVEDGAHPAMTGLRRAVEPELNALFFAPEGVDADDVPPRQGVIDPRGTRFDAGASTADGDAPAGKRQRQAVGMYSAVATPAVTPGASPIMTWGRVDATPLRLDPAGTEEEELLRGLRPAAGGVPAFTMAPPPRREAVGTALAHAVGARALRAGGNTPGRHARPPSSAPPSRGATPRSVAPSPVLSHAARRVLQRTAGDAAGPGGQAEIDLALRRSYAGSTPRATPAVTPRATPGSTPRAAAHGAEQGK